MSGKLQPRRREQIIPPFTAVFWGHQNQSTAYRCFRFLLSLLIVPVLLSACSVIAPPQVTAILPTRSTTPTVTATIVWFPPTHTPTPFPTSAPRQATPEQRPALGEVVLRDTFDSKAGWSTGQFAGGIASYSRSRLDVVAQGAVGASLVSLRSGAIPTDAYIEISATPSLCRGKDSYGLVFRAEGEMSHYRLIITCEGQLRVERWRPAEAGVVQDWTPSGQVPSGAPVALRLGIWMFRDEMRVFINDIYQFSARDPLLQGVQLGVFVRASAADAVSVSFSDLVVRRLENYIPSPVPSPTLFVIPTATRAPTFTPAP